MMLLVYNDGILVLVSILPPHSPLWLIMRQFKIQIRIYKLFDISFRVTIFWNPWKTVVNVFTYRCIFPIKIPKYLSDSVSKLSFIFHKLFYSNLCFLEWKFLNNREWHKVHICFFITKKAYQIHCGHYFQPINKSNYVLVAPNSK